MRSETSICGYLLKTMLPRNSTNKALPSEQADPLVLLPWPQHICVRSWSQGFLEDARLPA